MRRIPHWVVGVMLCSVLLLGISSAAVARVSNHAASAVSVPSFSTSQLLAPAGTNWIVQEGNLYGERYSSLNMVTPSNVAGMTEAWHVKLSETVTQRKPALPGEAPQLEYNGTLFGQDEYGGVYALNATTGQEIWQYQPHLPVYHIPASYSTAIFKVNAPGTSTRGLAIDAGKVFVEESGGQMLALNAATGKPIWSTQIAPPDKAIGLSQPPQYYNGMLLGATSGGDTGFPCEVFALNADTGKVLWKFQLIPNLASEPGYSTWSHPLTFDGGAAVWSQLGVDPSLGLVYVSTGNPIPYGGAERGPGAEYFTDGELALHLNTGKEAWFFQEVHHDSWDADQSQQGLLVNADGKKAIVIGNKDGLWYVLNRATGKPILPVKEMPVQQSAADHSYATEPIPSTTPLVPQTVPDPGKWKGLTGPDGKPYNIGKGPAGSFVAISPNQYSVTAAFGQGASGNKPGALDPNNGYLVEVTTPGFTPIEEVPNSEVAKMNYFNFAGVLDLKLGSLAGTPAASVAGTRLEVMDVNTGKRVWMDNRLNPTSAAAAKTATPFSGGVTISGDIIWANGGDHLQAFSLMNGKLLWSSPALATMSYSPPTVFAVGNTEYVTSLDAATGDLYAFSYTPTAPTKK